MVSLKDVVYAAVKEHGKKTNEIASVRPDDELHPTKVIVQFFDGTEMTIDLDYSKVEKH